MSIKDYCKQKNIPMHELAVITQISPTRLYEIDRNNGLNVTLETIEKIYNGTKQRFGKGLTPDQYLNINLSLWKTIFSQKKT